MLFNNFLGLQTGEFNAPGKCNVTEVAVFEDVTLQIAYNNTGNLQVDFSTTAPFFRIYSDDYDPNKDWWIQVTMSDGTSAVKRFRTEVCGGVNGEKVSVWSALIPDPWI